MAIGGHAPTLAEVPRSRVEADQALRVLATGRADVSVAEIDEVRMRSLVLRLADLVADEPLSISGPLGKLIRHDEENGTGYVHTLRTYLDSFGDLIKAASDLGIHPNTLRYRARKLREFSGADLDDPEERLALMLQLRLLDARPP